MTRTDVDTPLGTFVMIRDAGGRLRAAGFAEEHPRMAPWMKVAREDDPALARRARAWFDGDLTAFDDVEVAGEGTPFQEAVWEALRTIPRGETRTYAEIARAIGRPKAVRAVGAANGRNPISILVPCHRVIGADGTLTGYAGGLARKEWLLAHERRAQRGTPADATH